MPIDFDIIHDVLYVNPAHSSKFSDNDIELINERAVSKFCMREGIQGSKENVDQNFSAFLYFFNFEKGCYVAGQKHYLDNTPNSHNILRVYAIVRAKYNPPIVYQHLMDQWIRRPNSKNEKHLQLTEYSGDPYAKGFLAGFSIGVNHTKGIE